MEPLYVVTTEQMQAAEKAADAAGLNYDQMMENAGRAVAEAIDINFDVSGAFVLILVGPGNNGGDGLVTARYLVQMGALVTVYVWKRNIDGDKNWALLNETDVERLWANETESQERLTNLLYEADFVIDALLGTGVSRPIEGSLADLLDRTKAAVKARRRSQFQADLVEPARVYAEDSGGPVVVAVDVPSGLNSDSGAIDPHTLSADMTVTLAAVKQGHILSPGPNVVGRLVVGDIRIKPEHYPTDVSLEMATAKKITAMLPARPTDSHKGTFGTALLVAGSMDYTGAAILAGQAAVRAGTGLVTLAIPEPIHPIVASRVAEATYIPLHHQHGLIASNAASLVQEKLDRATALLVGPGLGNADSTARFLKDLLGTSNSLPPLVLDADALNILAKETEWWQLLPSESILTPHPGEIARLMDSTTREVQANRLSIATEMATKWGQVVLLKGAHTIISEPQGRTVIMPFANPALAKAGSGDVLAGTIVGLRAQGMGPFEAAAAGAYLHGLAGEFARGDLGATVVTAGDLVGFLAMAVRELTYL